MRATRKTRTRTAALLTAGVAVLAGAGCGEEDFKNEPRPPAAVELTGVIQRDSVTVSPDSVAGPGPVRIIVSNQTEEAHTVTLEGDTVSERVGPINPQDTATIQKTLRTGIYEVRAGSEVAVPQEIEPAELRVGDQHRDSNDRLLLP